MSSQFPGKSSKDEVIIVAESWEGLVLARALASYGVSLKLLTTEDRLGPSWLPIFVGNGDCYARAQASFGPSLASSLWDISLANFEEARELTRQLRVRALDSSTLWFCCDEIETKFLEESLTQRGFEYRRNGPNKRLSIKKESYSVFSGPGIAIDHQALKLALLSSHPEPNVSVRSVDQVLGIESRGPFDYVVTFNASGSCQSERGTLVVLASESLVPSLFPRIRDRWIPVSLSSFTFFKVMPLDFSLALFHWGSDFAVSGVNCLRVGSFRNLYADKAVGLDATLDKATQKGVTGFFSRLGWIDPAHTPVPMVSVEAISCDGVPLVGSLPEYPGIYVVGAFSGHTGNFMFEVAKRLASSIVGSHSFSSLDCFSTKRFV